MNNIPKQILLSYITPHELDEQLVRHLNDRDTTFLYGLNEVLIKAAPESGENKTIKFFLLLRLF